MRLVSVRTCRESGLITGERRGTWIHYRVEPATLARPATILSIPT